MSQPFDATLKDIVRRHVADYAAAFRLPNVHTALDVDLSTVSAATDVVLADANPPRVGVTTLDFQSRHNEFLDDRILMYHALLRSRFHLPVHSVVLLLRSDAFRPATTGGVRYRTAGGRGKMDFSYELVRLWEVPAAELLAAPIGSAVLAVLGRLPDRGDVQAGLTDVLHELDRRLRTEAAPAEAGDLLAAVGVLMGLRVPRQVGAALLQRVRAMEESTTYQIIIEKGEARGEVTGARKALMSLARRKLGRPSKKTVAALEQITNVERLVRMTAALLDVKTWDDLLAVE